MKVYPRAIKRPNSVKGFREVGGSLIYFKSTWEIRYARYLEFLRCRGDILEWLYEPQTFWFVAIKRGVRSYLPDFKIINSNGSHCWVEVKGYMDSKSATKLKRFKKYYPNEKISIVDGKWFKANNAMLRALVPNWE